MMEPINLPPVQPQGRFDAIDPFDGRYYDEEVAAYLSERARVTYQAYVEAALAYTLADFGVCSKEVAEEIAAATKEVTAEEVAGEESRTKHDVKALVDVIKSKVTPEAGRYVHFGATSYDIVATALALQLRDATQKAVMPRLIELQRTLLDLTEKYADTVQIGRTHGQHAVPITFGFALAEYVSRLGGSLKALNYKSQSLRGKFSGAVGAYNGLSVFVDDAREFEKQLLAKLDLKPAAYSSQIIPAENTIRLLNELAISAGVMANLANDLRHLQRTEIAEVHEKFESGQTGSSTMAHKQNPISFENVASLYKQVNAQLVNANANLISDHQRDLTDSASMRFYPLVLAGVAVMAKRLQAAMARLEVNEENMRRNLHLSRGAIAAEPLYLLLAKYGHPSAHEASKTLSHKALAAGLGLTEVLNQEPELASYLKKFSPDEAALLAAPEIHYTGQAAAKARHIAQRQRRLINEP